MIRSFHSLTLRAHFVRPNRLRRFVEPYCLFRRFEFILSTFIIGPSLRPNNKCGGERGIRTLEGVLALTPLAGERFRPLSHLSEMFDSSLSYVYSEGLTRRFAPRPFGAHSCVCRRYAPRMTRRFAPRPFGRFRFSPVRQPLPCRPRAHIVRSGLPQVNPK